MQKILLLYNTIKYLKLTQIFYQVWYRLVKIKPLNTYYSKESISHINYLTFSDFLPVLSSADGKGNFNFLNIAVCFPAQIDWGYMENGKLWNYNLHYANYLLQEDINLEKRIGWLKSLHSKLNKSSKNLEPYPVSLRVINTIRLLSRHKVVDNELTDSLYAECKFLSTRLEYHLLANHLLENAFALILAGAFFNKQEWTNTGGKLLSKQLSEQILKDGAHFELSPMYHQIILYRLLELIDWYRNWDNHISEFLIVYKNIAKSMLYWLSEISFNNGDIPLLSDSAKGITYETPQLISYANYLGVLIGEGKLNDSGYRKFNVGDFQCIVDVGNIAVNYQPAHGHADALSFILYIFNKPILVDTGTSTYQPNKRRAVERGSSSHNTVVINNEDQSQVWGGFRVGKRAKVSLLVDSPSQVSASHDGYGSKRIHRRDFAFNEKSVTITDAFEAHLMVNSKDIIAYFHLAPGLLAEVKADSVIIDNTIIMQFEGARSIELGNYKFSDRFNKYEDGIVIKVFMGRNLNTIITI